MVQGQGDGARRLGLYRRSSRNWRLAAAEDRDLRSSSQTSGPGLADARINLNFVIFLLPALITPNGGSMWKELTLSCLQVSALLLWLYCIGVSIVILRHSTKRLKRLQTDKKTTQKTSHLSESGLLFLNKPKTGDLKYAKASIRVVR